MSTIACDACRRLDLPVEAALFSDDGQWIICASCLRGGTLQATVERDVRKRKQRMNNGRAMLLADTDDTTLASWAQGGAVDAGVELIERHERLIQKIAKKWAGYTDMTEEDLLSIGKMALLDALQSYDPKQGTKVTTWATYKINKDISDAVREFNPLHLGHNLYWNIRKLERISNEMYQELKREPTNEELVDRMNETVTTPERKMTVAKVKQIKQAAHEADVLVSLDKEFEPQGFSDEDSEVLSLLDTVDSGVNIEEDYMEKEEISELFSNLDLLTGEQRDVIQLRYFEGQTWEETAQSLEVSRSTAIRRENEALEVLKAAMPA